MKKGKNKIRPYWHVDAKWISGIILSFLLCMVVFSYGLMKITEEDIAVDVSAYAIAATFSENGLSDTTAINDMKDMIRASKDGYIKPINGLDVVVTLEDLEGKTPEEIKIDIFRRIAAPMYEGSEGLAKIAENEDIQKNIEEGQGILKLFTRDTNIFARMQFYGFVFASIIFLALTIFFSYGFGRLVSPAVIALVVGLPNVVFWGVLNLISKNINEVKIPFISSSEGSDHLTNSITDIASNALPQIASTFYTSYGYLVIVSVVLLVAAIIGKIFSKIRDKKLNK